MIISKHCVYTNQVRDHSNVTSAMRGSPSSTAWCVIGGNTVSRWTEGVPAVRRTACWETAGQVSTKWKKTMNIHKGGLRKLLSAQIVPTWLNWAQQQWDEVLLTGLHVDLMTYQSELSPMCYCLGNLPFFMRTTAAINKYRKYNLGTFLVVVNRLKCSAGMYWYINASTVTCMYMEV